MTTPLGHQSRLAYGVATVSLGGQELLLCLPFPYIQGTEHLQDISGLWEITGSEHETGGESSYYQWWRHGTGRC